MSESPRRTSLPASPTPSAPTPLVFQNLLSSASTSPRSLSEAAGARPWIDDALSAVTEPSPAQLAVEKKLMQEFHSKSTVATTVPALDVDPTCDFFFVSAGGKRVLASAVACRVNTAVLAKRSSPLFRALLVTERTKFNLGSGPTGVVANAHVCAANSCDPATCPFVGIPCNACRILLEHGVCVDKKCPFYHFSLVALTPTRVVTIQIMMNVSCGNRARFFSPLWALLPHEQRLEAERAAVAALERRIEASQHHVAGHRRREAAQERRDQLVEKKVATDDKRLDMAMAAADVELKYQKFARSEKDMNGVKPEPDDE